MDMIIDRIEGEIAVVELPDKSTVNISRRVLPEDAREGSVIRIIVDGEKTIERRDMIRDKMKKLKTK